MKRISTFFSVLVVLCTAPAESQVSMYNWAGGGGLFVSYDATVSSMRWFGLPTMNFPGGGEWVYSINYIPNILDHPDLSGLPPAMDPCIPMLDFWGTPTSLWIDVTAIKAACDGETALFWDDLAWRDFPGKTVGNLPDALESATGYEVAYTDGRVYNSLTGITTTVAPEPATMALLGTGLVGLAVMRRRARKKEGSAA